MLQTPYRPFFALATASAVVLMLVWLLSWHGEVVAARYYGPIGWHVHEMLFGFTTAVIAGFLLTAARNWSGRATASGAFLLTLVLAWLAGRVTPWIAGIDPFVVAATDLAFLPLLTVAATPAIMASSNRANRIFLLVLAMMALANFWSHAEALQLVDTSGHGARLMLDLVTFLMLMLGGRLLPFFTSTATAVERRDLPLSWVQLMSVVFVVAILLRAGDMLAGLSPALLIATGVFHLARIPRWFNPGVMKHPMLLVLYAGFACVAAGIVLGGISGYGWFVRSYANHMLTVGGIGLLTMGMMARVSLGHSGRPVIASAASNAAFIMLALALLMRVAGPWLFPVHYVGWILLSGTLWVAAFVLLLIQYMPCWLLPRVDGRPG
jgi:uncharacterized protein involved in response to NO